MSSLNHSRSAQLPIGRGTSDISKLTSESLQPRTRLPKIIAVGSGKGGVGKTFFAANLGHHISLQSKSVVLVDANFGGPSLHTYFNLDTPKLNLKELITDPDADINQLIQKTRFPNLRVICGAPGTLGFSENAPIIASRIIRSIKRLNADYIILDLGTGTNLSDVILFLQADEGVIVTNPEPTSIQEAFNFFKFCLLKKLELIVKGQPNILAHIDRAYDHIDVETGENLKSLIRSLNTKDSRRKLQFQNFRPGFLLNMVYYENELVEATAFQMAIEEIFGIRLKYWGSMNFYSEIKKSSLLNGQGDKYEHLTSFYINMARQLINIHALPKNASQNILTRKHGVRTSRTVDYEQGTLICSSKCSLWNNCARQRGGYPCKMKYIGFIKSL